MGRRPVEQIGNGIAKEINHIVQDVKHSQDNNTDLTKETQRALHRLDQEINTVSNIVGAATGGWRDPAAERSIKCDKDKDITL